MMPHETETDRQNQARIVAEWAPSHAYKPVRIAAVMPRIDYALMGADEIVGFAEVKTCGWPFGSFAVGYLLEVEKCTAGEQVRFAFSLPCYLVVEFTDALAWLDMTTVVQGRGHKLERRDRGTVVDAHAFRWKDFTVDRIEPGLLAHAPAEHDPRPPA